MNCYAVSVFRSMDRVNKMLVVYIGNIVNFIISPILQELDAF